MLASEDPTEIRGEDIAKWIKFFSDEYNSKCGVKLDFVDDAAESMNDVYWTTVKEKVRPLVNHTGNGNIDRHKIISVLELTVMYLLPISHDDPERRIELNAQLALFIGKTLLCNWAPNKYDFKSVIEDNRAFNREHLMWLRMAEAEGFPIFSNAMVWYLFEDNCTASARFIPA